MFTMAETNWEAFHALHERAAAKPDGFMVQQELELDLFREANGAYTEIGGSQRGVSIIRAQVARPAKPGLSPAQLQMETALSWEQPDTRVAHVSHTTWVLSARGARQLDALTPLWVDANVLTEQAQLYVGSKGGTPAELLHAWHQAAEAIDTAPTDGVQRKLSPRLVVAEGEPPIDPVVQQSIHSETVRRARNRYHHLGMLAVRHDSSYDPGVLPYLEAYTRQRPPANR
jgi:hypothetical protein